MIRESQLERRFAFEVMRRGAWALKFVSPGMRGVPDRVVLLPGGRTVFAEIKRPGETPDELQKKRAKQLMALGFQVYCLDSYQAIDDFMTEVFGNEQG